jgi:hypothetical protein
MGVFIFLLIIIYRTQILKINENVYVMDLLENWEKKTISNFYIASANEECENKLFVREWEGTGEACDCRYSYHYGVKSDIFKGECSFIQTSIGCKEINRVLPVLADKWKGAKVCVESSEYNYYDSVTIIGDKCPKKYILCGTDTKNFNLCFPKKHGCPVNKIKISNYQNLPKNEKKYFQTLQLNEDWYVKYSEGRVCINPSETNLKSGYQKFKKINTVTNSELPSGPSCLTKIGKFNIDERYKSIDSVSKFKFYTDNNILKRIDNLPQINPQDLINYNAYLYQRSYIHWSPHCRAHKDLAPDMIVKDLIKISTLDGYLEFFKFFCFLAFTVFSVQTVLFLLSSKRLNLFLENLSTLMVITMIPLSFLIIFSLHQHSYLTKKLMSQKCGDYITNMTLNNIGKNLNDLTISFYQILLITIVLLSVLIVNSIIKN